MNPHTPQTHTRNVLWKTEHPKADVPSLITNHPDLVDVSWHNDACPSFTFQGGGEGQVDNRLWVDYADKELRETEKEGNRFLVTTLDWDTSKSTDHYNGNDASEAIKALLALKP